MGRQLRGRLGGFCKESIKWEEGDVGGEIGERMVLEVVEGKSG